MANFSRIRLLGFWTLGSVVDPEEFEAIDAIRPLLINADGGSTHAPTIQIIIGGAGARISGPSRLDDITVGVIQAGGTLSTDAMSSPPTASSGGQIINNGTISCESGGQVLLKSGSLTKFLASSGVTVEGGLSYLSGATLTMGNGSASVWNSGATLTQGSGSTWTINGAVNWGANNWPGLSSRTVKRCQWQLAWFTYSGTPPSGPRAWLENSNGQTGGSCIQCSTETVANHAIGVELFNLPPGAPLNSVTVSSKGTAGPGASTTFPKYYIMRWQKGADWESMSGVNPVDDAHTTLNWTTTIVDTTITCTAHQVIDPAYHYGIFIYQPHEAGGAAAKFIDFVPDLTAASIQL